MVAKEGLLGTDSPKPEVGEIDTSAPFQSVKDAVNLFGEGAFSGEKVSIRKPKAHSAERVLAKETQFHIAKKELEKLKEKLRNAETTKSQALVELEKAKIMVDDMTQKLKAVSESKEIAIGVTETANNQAKQIEEAKNGKPCEIDVGRTNDLESARQQYMATYSELDVAKQNLQKMRQNCDASLEAKLTALNQAEDAENAAKSNMEKVGELSKEISALQESIGQVKLASLESQQEQTKLVADKDLQRELYKATLEESTQKLIAAKKEFHPEVVRNLEAQLAEAHNDVVLIQNKMENVKTSDLDNVRLVTLELDDAKSSLQKVVEDEILLRKLVDSLKLELENVKKDHLELKAKEAETESIAGNLHVKLCKSKSELETCLSEESKARGATEEIVSTLQELALETENARRDAEEMKNKAEELKREAQATKIELEEVEKRLRVALEEAEEAKLAEGSALNQIKTLSEKTTAARASTSESGANITISREEFESLSRKVEESEKLAEMKVAAAMAQVEAVKSSENEALKRLEATQKEIEEMKATTKEALKRGEMAEAAKRAVEGELRRWREREQKKAAEAASRALAEMDVSVESSPHHYRIHKQNPTEKIKDVKKFQKERSFVSRKVLLPSFTGIFHRKSSQVDGGSPSYLPGEKPV